MNFSRKNVFSYKANLYDKWIIIHLEHLDDSRPQKLEANFFY